MPPARTSSVTPVPANAELASTLRMAVLRLARRLRNQRNPDVELTPNQLAVLGTLNRCGPLRLGELADAERVQPPSMTRIVNGLTDKGLAVRRPHETDRRQVLVEPTPEGGVVMAESRRRKDVWLSDQFDELSPAELETLRRAAPLLERLAGQ